MSALTSAEERRPGEALRWGAAACVVTALHLGAGWWLLHRALPLPPPPEGTPGIVIDLEPVAVPTTAAVSQPLALPGAAQAPAVSEAPEPQPTAAPMSESASPPVAVPPVAVPEPPGEAALPAEAAAPIPEPAPTLPEPTPQEPVVPAPASPAPAEAVLPPVPPERPPSPPVPSRPKPATVRPKPPVPKPEVMRPDPRQLARAAAQRDARAEARAQARADIRAARAAALRQGGGPATEAAAPRPVASGAEVASWRGAVVAHLNAYKPASPNGAEGTVRVSFAVDRGGRVVSAAVAGSSGDPSLDQAALAMVRRASPVPAPPPELGGRITLAVPVRFH